MNIPTVCPFCGHQVTKVSNAIIYGKQYGSGMCYKCTHCDAYVGCHPDGQPLGTLANKETRELRKKCHSIFDVVWKLGGIDRNKCYKILAERLGIPREDCHFAHFDIPMLKKALDILPDLKQELLKSK